MAWIARAPALPLQLRIGLILLLAGIATVATFSISAFPQPLWYHEFADQRMFCRVPNFANVTSNVGFALAGAAGLWILWRLPAGHPATRAPYVVFALGLILVAAGSAYYHYAPTTESLYWDRLPMTIAFMALLSALIADRIDRRAGLVLLPVLLLAGLAGVSTWHYSELAGTGDLRPYLLVQVVAMVSLPLILLLFRDRIGGDHYLVLLLALYGLAVALENTDRWFLEATTGLVSGHTLKHLVAALAAYFALYRLLKNPA